VKRILSLLGSPRKENTHRLLTAMERALEAAGDTEIRRINLTDVNLQRCAGCHLCLTRGIELCPLRDDLTRVLESIRSADGLILAAPVYIMQVPGLVKTLFDRLAFLCHRPELYGTHALVMATTGAMGLKDVLGYMSDVAMVWGCRSVTSIGAATPPGGLPDGGLPEKLEARILRTAARFLSRLEKGSEYPIALRSLIQFRLQRRLFIDPSMADIMPEDYRHYTALRNVAYPATGPVGPAKRAAAWLVEKAAAPFM
jgi:NAD(P)H-dependent FMN reductase